MGLNFGVILANGAIFGHSNMPGSIRSRTARYRSAVGRDGIIVERGGLITVTWRDYGGFMAGLAGLPSLSARSGRSGYREYTDENLEPISGLKGL